MKRWVLFFILVVAGFLIAQTPLPSPSGAGGSAAPSGKAGGDLGGTYPNPTVLNGSNITNSSIPNSGLVNTGVSVNGTTCTLGSSCAPGAAPTGSAGGDLSSTYPNPTVAKVNGNTPGGTCTIQFARSIDSSGRPTCAAIVNGDLASATTAGLAENTNLYFTNARVVTELSTLNGTSQFVHCSGTAYTLTASNATVTFGTTSPTITLSTAGTYMLFWNARVDHSGATYSANRVIQVFLQRTNNTPAAVGFGAALTTNIITTTTETAEGGNMSGFSLYTTANTTDTIVLQASVSVLPSTGSSTVSACQMEALRIF